MELSCYPINQGQGSWGLNPIEDKTSYNSDLSVHDVEKDGTACTASDYIACGNP